MTMLPSAVRIFLCTRPTDMQKGFDGLTGLVQERFGQDPLTGHLFLFINRRKNPDLDTQLRSQRLGTPVQATRGRVLQDAPHCRTRRHPNSSLCNSP